MKDNEETRTQDEETKEMNEMAIMKGKVDILKNRLFVNSPQFQGLDSLNENLSFLTTSWPNRKRKSEDWEMALEDGLLTVQMEEEEKINFQGSTRKELNSNYFTFSQIYSSCSLSQWRAAFGIIWSGR